MDVTIEKAALCGSLKAPASKSEAHRLMICSALSDSETEIFCRGSSEDIETTRRCLTALGARLRETEQGFLISPVQKQGGQRILPCKESGSTLRFLLPVAAALGGETVFQMEGRLPERPISPLKEEMEKKGCVFSKPEENQWLCRGKLESGAYRLRGDISSQFISGLLFALPLLLGDSTLTLEGEIQSAPYIEMTMDAIRQFGVELISRGARIEIPGGQQYKSPKTAKVGGDWSNSAFWLCAGAMGDRPITVCGLEPDSRQGDKAVLDILRRFGAKVEAQGDRVTVSPAALHGTTIDAEDIPDLVPVLAAVAAVSEGKTVIRGAGRLRIKESDRLKTVSETLSRLGADVEPEADGLVITGRARLSGGRVDAFGDHRIAMTAAVCAVRSDAPVTICGAEAVNKSYPTFFEEYRALGGTVRSMPI